MSYDENRMQDLIDAGLQYQKELTEKGIYLTFTNKCRVLFVKIPEEASRFFTAIGFLFTGPLNKAITLPSGNWKYLSLLNEATEEQAAVIVDESKHHAGFQTNYSNASDDSVTQQCSSYKESLISLAQSVGVDTNKNWAVCFELKK